ncbi:MAG: type I-U CRISPR-associated protein Cas5/Cas6 [Phycisphaerales bacterium]|nr:type I-U CRISPR-associated protein Cas5/Cas6 [Phycisphaerales bacterium]
MATHPTNREMAEWPPHPDRVFMALAAAHFETEGDEDERHALEWLQSLPAPALAATEAYYRDIVTSYVPVNDTEISRPKNDSSEVLAKRLAGLNSVAELKEAKRKGLSLMPEHRSRQARPFPVAIPQPMDNATGSYRTTPHVYLTWDNGVPAPIHRQSLVSLCTKVVSIGHSASLVQVWVESSPPPANLIPVENVVGKHRLRVTSGDRLKHLELKYRAGLRPASSRWQGYAEVATNRKVAHQTHTVFDSSLLIFRRVEGPRLALETTLQIMQALRSTVMKSFPVQPPPAWVSGHAADGSPSRLPHLAFLPLAHVGRRYADGDLLGVAIAVPREASQGELGHLGRIFLGEEGEPRRLRLLMGRVGAWEIELCDTDDLRIGLQSSTWTNEGTVPSTEPAAGQWATVTPIVFDRYPKSPGEGEETIAISCERIALPRPTGVVICSSPAFSGVPHASRFPPLTDKKQKPRYHSHAVLTFDRPIIGPVLLGAGRYRGYGLCRPLRNGVEQ